MTKTPSTKCSLYKPGHLTHFIQARLHINKPRFEASIELIDPVTLLVRFLDQELLLRNHSATHVYNLAQNAKEEGVKYAPESKLLYVHTRSKTTDKYDAFYPAYMTEQELTACESHAPGAALEVVPIESGTGTAHRKIKLNRAS